MLIIRTILAAAICITFIFGLDYYRLPKSAPESQINAHFWEFKKQLDQVKKMLIEHKQKYGRYPDNDEGLLALDEFRKQMENVNPDVLDFFYKGDLMPSEAGVLSLWGVPLMYENRSGLDPALFDFSPVNQDPDWKYSIEVDKDIYVYSVGWMEYRNEELKHHEDAINKWHNKHLIKNIITIIIVVLFVLLVGSFFLKQKQPASKKFVILHAVISGLAIVASYMMGSYEPKIIACYIAIPFGGIKKTAYIKKHAELLEKYEKAGIIKNETYFKLRKAVEKL